MKDNTVEAEIVEDSQIVLSEIKYPVSTTDLKALLEEYKEIPEIDPDADEEIVGKEYQFVLAGHKAFVKARTGIEKTRKQLKQPALDYGKKVDEIAKEFQAIISGTESKLQIQRKKVEDNEARKQREAEEKEEARVDAIRTKIKDYENIPLRCISLSSDNIKSVIENDILYPTTENFEEFLDEAFQKHSVCMTQLNEMVSNKILVENAEKIQAERDAEAKRLQDEKDEAMRLEREAFEQQQREFQKQKDDFERQQREQQEALDRQEAERVANELQAKQEAERQQREQQGKELMAKSKHETYEDLQDYVGADTETLIDAIMDGKIRHIKWEV